MCYLHYLEKILDKDKGKQIKSLVSDSGSTEKGGRRYGSLLPCTLVKWTVFCERISSFSSSSQLPVYIFSWLLVQRWCHHLLENSCLTCGCILILQSCKRGSSLLHYFLLPQPLTLMVEILVIILSILCSWPLFLAFNSGLPCRSNFLNTDAIDSCITVARTY